MQNFLWINYKIIKIGAQPLYLPIWKKLLHDIDTQWSSALPMIEQAFILEYVGFNIFNADF